MAHVSLRESFDNVLKRAGLSAVPPRVVLGIAGAALLLATACLIRWWPATETEFAVRDASAQVAAASTSSEASAAASQAESPTVAPMAYVHVVGAVRSPGVVCLPAGSRMADAIAAAGGLLSNAQPRGVNLARIIVDGEQVVVPTQDEWEAAGGAAAGAGGAAGAGPASGSPAGPAAGAKIDLNTAGAEQLDALPGVGPSTAAKIVADREANGPFTAPEDLMRVSGIGPKKFEALKDFLLVP